MRSTEIDLAPLLELAAAPQTSGVVTVVGDAVVNHVYRVDDLPVAGASTPGSFEAHPGGKGLDCAVAVARLGLRVRLITAIGDDDTSSHLLGYLHGENVETELVKIVPGASGPITAVMLANGGAHALIGLRDDRARLSAQDIRSSAIHAAIASADAIVMTFEQSSAVLEQVLAEVRGLDSPPLLIVRPSPKLAPSHHLDEYLGAIDYLVGISEELAALPTDVAATSIADTARRLRGLGVGSVCALEPVECTVWSDTVNTVISSSPETFEHAPGALAAFTAALIYRLVSTGRRAAEASDYAWATAAMTATQPLGAVPDPMPLVRDIDRTVRRASDEP
ncbi:carbohydrate kinase family protein [Nocardia sp. NBC_01499]|uniref:PfkB family carbohydrate kinase n=1 Tax=Nocardia sp. NBC_01499 TaxID=2903597 RepID=UPI003869B847